MAGLQLRLRLQCALVTCGLLLPLLGCAPNDETADESIARAGSEVHYASLSPGSIVRLVTLRTQGNGNATLIWESPVPAETSVGNAETVAGYTVYVGRSPDRMMPEAIVVGASNTKYVVQRLPPGMHYFAVTSFTRNGTESVMSPIASKTID